MPISKERSLKIDHLELARPWQHHQEAYRPLGELAKARGIPFIVANVSRRTVAVVAMADAITSDVLRKESIYLPQNLDFDSKEYYNHFIALMEKMPRSFPMKGFDVEALNKAQVLKDAVMAVSPKPFVDQFVLSCCGHFDCDDHPGIPYQLQKNHPELRIALVVCTESVADRPVKDRSRVADFIWIDE